MSFHVVKEDSIPEYLVSDWKNAPTQVECGAGSGQRREAITHKKFKLLFNSGHLRVKQMCKACARKLGVRVQKEEVE